MFFSLFCDHLLFFAFGNCSHTCPESGCQKRLLLLEGLPIVSLTRVRGGRVATTLAKQFFWAAGATRARLAATRPHPEAAATPGSQHPVTTLVLRPDISSIASTNRWKEDRRVDRAHMYGYRVIVSIRGRREYKGSYIFVRMCGCAPLNGRLHTNPDYRSRNPKP